MDFSGALDASVLGLSVDSLAEDVEEYDPDEGSKLRSIMTGISNEFEVEATKSRLLQIVQQPQRQSPVVVSLFQDNIQSRNSSQKEASIHSSLSSKASEGNKKIILFFIIEQLIYNL